MTQIRFTSIPNVIVAEEEPEPVRFAADELRRYLGRILKGSAPLKPGSTVPSIRLFSHQDEDRVEKIEIFARDGDLCIRAALPGNVLFGAYEFLRRYGGCRFAGPAPDCEYVPHRESIIVGELPCVLSTSVWHRSLQLHWRTDNDMLPARIDWMAKNGFNFLDHNLCMDKPATGGHGAAFDPETGEARHDMNGRFTESYFKSRLLPELRKRGIVQSTIAHNLLNFLPPDKYLADHPEWYALTGGKRFANGCQLCLCTSNAEMVREYVSNVLEYLRSRPDVKLISIGPMDGIGGCECDNCRAMDYSPDDIFRGSKVHHRCPEAENPSKIRRYALFLNEIARGVAKEFPGVLAGYQGYVDLNFPPRDVEFEQNIYAMASTYWRCGAHPIRADACDANRFFDANIRAWSEKLPPARLIVGDNAYMGMCCQHALPYPIHETILVDWHEFKRLGIGGNFAQLHDESFITYALNYGAFGRACWDDEADASALLDEHLLGMFGPAGADLRPVYDSFHATVRKIATQGKSFSIYLREDLQKNHLKRDTACEACLEPMAANIACFLDEPGEDRLNECIARARETASDEREKRQVERFSIVAGYWTRAASFYRIYWPVFAEGRLDKPDALPELKRSLAALRDLAVYLDDCPLRGSGWMHRNDVNYFKTLAANIGTQIEKIEGTPP